MKGKIITVLVIAVIILAAPAIYAVQCSKAPESSEKPEAATDYSSGQQDTQMPDAREPNAEEPGQITAEEAKVIVQKELPDVPLDQINLWLEMEDGVAVYEGGLFYNEREYEFEIRASDGTILNWEVESR